MKLFVWDFHGVLETGNELAVREITNAVLKKFGYKMRMSQEECAALYGKKWFEYFQYLLPEGDIEIWMKLQEHCAAVGLENPMIIAKYIRATDHAYEVLKKIEEKHEQVLISNSRPKSLEMFLKLVGLDLFFTERNAFAVAGHVQNAVLHKSDMLKDFMEGKEYEKLVVIGDSPSDMELGSVFESVRYLYAHPGRRHRDAEADFKIHDLREVLREV